MAFTNQIRWVGLFTGPDGQHVMSGYASTKEKAVAGFRQSLSTNSELTLDEGSVKPASANDVDNTVAALRAADPSRPLATDLGLDDPSRILHEPWTLPGSQIQPPAPTE